jgi:hypothetical protein
MTFENYTLWLIREHEIAGHITARDRELILKDLEACKDSGEIGDGLAEYMIMKRVKTKVRSGSDIPLRPRL